MQADELVNVLVPRRHLSQVYGFIARLESGEAQGGVPSGAPPEGNDNNGSAAPAGNGDEWTQSRLRRAVQESSPAMVKILGALAAKPGQWLSTSDLAAALGPEADWKTVAGTLGAFGRRVASRYGLQTFPFENRYDHAARGRVCRMSEEIARVIKRLIADL